MSGNHGGSVSRAARAGRPMSGNHAGPPGLLDSLNRRGCPTLAGSPARLVPLPTFFRVDARLVSRMVKEALRDLRPKQLR